MCVDLHRILSWHVLTHAYWRLVWRRPRRRTIRMVSWWQSWHPCKRPSWNNVIFITLDDVNSYYTPYRILKKNKVTWSNCTAARSTLPYTFWWQRVKVRRSISCTCAYSNYCTCCAWVRMRAPGVHMSDIVQRVYVRLWDYVRKYVSNTPLVAVNNKCSLFTMFLQAPFTCPMQSKILRRSNIPWPCGFTLTERWWWRTCHHKMGGCKETLVYNHNCPQFSCRSTDNRTR